MSARRGNGHDDELPEDEAPAATAEAPPEGASEAAPEGVQEGLQELPPTREQLEELRRERD